MTQLVGIMTFVMFVELIVAVLILPQVVGVFSVVGLYIIQFGFLTMSFVQIMAFVPPQPKYTETELSTKDVNSTINLSVVY